MKGIIITALLCLMACSNLKNQEPEYLIDKKTMGNIIADIHLAEAKVQNMNFHTSDSSFHVFKNLEAEVFKKYNTDKKTYDSSYNYYSKNLKEFNEIYEKAIDTLNIRHTKFVDLQ